MSLLIFFIILSTLVVVHEFGHFSVAKFFGIRVDEFGLGFPPQVKKLFSWKGTIFTLNWLPFGGFVKIFGENPEPASVRGESQPDSFQNKNRGIQAAVLVAGVVCNLLFAWVLISLGFMNGMPAPTALDLPAENTRTIITTVLPDSPADLAGLRSGDAILSVSIDDELVLAEENLSPETVSNLIAESREPISFYIDRGGENDVKTVVPQEGIVEGKFAIGVSMDLWGTVKLSFFSALSQGLKVTYDLTRLTALAIGDFLFQALGGQADLSTVTGPVGIVGMVGEVRELGFSYLLTFTAAISLNLAIINLLPFPALDGGRLLFVGIEAITRRQVPPRIFNIVNTIGFALLIILMLFVTIQDVRNIL